MDELQSMGIKIYLITDCICVFLATLTIVGNSAILYMFYSGKLDSRRNLRIILYMTVTDLSFCFMILPQVFYMIAYWEPAYIDYDPIVMASTGWPLPMCLKITLGLNIGAATERILALYFPVAYRKVEHVKCSNVLLTVSLIFGLIDTFFAIFSFYFEQRINCSSIGCFVHSYFRTYWGASNMSCGAVVILMSVFVFFKVQKLGRQSESFEQKPKERKRSTASQKFRQANLTTCGVLMSCLFCLTIPSLLISLIETLTGFSVFEKIGAFYILSLLSNCFVNCFIFLLFHGSLKPKVETKIVSDAMTTMGNSKLYSSRKTTLID